MIEIIKEASTMLKDLPELAIWILVGILFYKIFIIGGIIAVIKLAINKFHDLAKNSSDNKVKPKEVITKHEIDGLFITDAKVKFDVLLEKLRSARHFKNNLYRSEYIHMTDIDFLLEAIEEKQNREKEAKNV